MSSDSGTTWERIYGIWYTDNEETVGSNERSRLVMEKTTVYLGSDSKRALRAKARRLGCTEAELIRQAIDGSLDREESLLPKSIGLVADGTISAAEAKQRLRKEWKSART